MDGASGSCSCSAKPDVLQPVWDCMGLHGTAWDCMGLHRIAWDCTAPVRVCEKFRAVHSAVTHPEAPMERAKRNLSQLMKNYNEYIDQCYVIKGSVN